MNIQDAHSDDAVNIAPHLHKILLEENDIRVLKVTVKPGETAEMHWHPRNINYIISPGTLAFTKEDGSVIEIELAVGQVTSGLAGSHAVKNIGDTTVETVQVELKDVV